MGQTETRGLSGQLQELLRDYRYENNILMSNKELPVYCSRGQPKHQICVNSISLPKNDGQTVLFQTHNYFVSRAKFNHSLVLELHCAIFYNAASKQYLNFSQESGHDILNQTKSCRTERPLCSLPIFVRHEQEQIFQIKLAHAYYPDNLQKCITERARRRKAFNQEQIWSIICSCTLAATELLSAGFKEPLLSPKAIKVTRSGQIKVAQWELSHIYEEEWFGSFPKVSQSQTSSKRNLKASDIFANFYWAPEGIVEIQRATEIGRKSLESDFSSCRVRHRGQIFSLGMTVLQMCLLRDLYQSETFSERSIIQLLEEAAAMRNRDIPLSGKLMLLLRNMLKWDFKERITYESLRRHVQDFMRTQDQLFSTTSYEEDGEGIDENESSIHESHTFMARSNDVDGSGSINQGTGDLYCPEEEGEVKESKLTKTTINYECIDYTLHSPFQSNKPHSLLTKITPAELRRDSPPLPLLLASEDQGTFEELITQFCFTGIEVEVSDDYVENQESVSILPQSQENSKLCDIFNVVEAHTIRDAKQPKYTVQKMLDLPARDRKSEGMFVPKLHFDESFDFRATLLPTHSCELNLGESSIKDVSCHDCLFTDPKLLAEIKESTQKLGNNLSGKENGEETCTEKKQLDRKVGAGQQWNESESVQLNHQSQYVKESFSKGYYEGSKVQGMRNGYGIFYYNQGGKYCGDWMHDQMHGKGTLYYADGRIAYQGQWRNDTLYGKGILYNEKPTQISSPFNPHSFDESEECWVYYKGQFFKDDKSGKGMLLLSNSQWYEGDFKNDAVDGRGVFHSLDGSLLYGQWKTNKLIKVLNNHLPKSK